MSLSPDGKYVAYGTPPRAGAKGLDIFVMPVDGSRETLLIDHPANDGVLGWTPDGRGLLFASDRTGSVGAWFVRVRDGRADGQPELVKQDIGRIKPLGFTRDASFFYTQDASIIRVNLADIDPLTGKSAGAPSPISQPLDVPVYSLDWSPDGQSFAYVTDRKSIADRTSGPIVYDSRVISIRSLGTGEERLLSPPMKVIVNINWSPDGRSFLLRGYDNDGGIGLHIVDAQTGKLMTSMPGGYWGSWSRDGKAVFYCKNDAPSKSTRLVARDLSSGDDRFLFSGPVGMSVAASPDGERLAFWSSSEECILYVMTLKDGQNREVYRLKDEDFGGLAWSSDSRRIYFVRRNFKENKHEHPSGRETNGL
jgi:Tol biopolymer transport system component